jgi:hypothetical protein
MQSDAIQRVTQAIARRIEAALDPIPNYQDKVVVGAPNAPKAMQAQIVVFPYRLAVDPTLRNAPRILPPVDRNTDPVAYEEALPLDFLITIGSVLVEPPDVQVAMQHTLWDSLGRAVRALQSDPFIMGEAVGGDTVRLSLEAAGTDEISRVWALFPNADYRTSIIYLASPVWIDAKPAIAGAPVVDDRRRARGRRSPARRPPGPEDVMTFPLAITGPELVRRRVLFAVALVDPVTGARVSRDVRVFADGVSGPPIVNRSGLFVWLAEGAARPKTVRVVPKGAPFGPETVAVPALPDPPPDDSSQPSMRVDPAQRLLRIVLRPTDGYAFPDGVTLLHGRLLETATPGAAAVAGVACVAQWRDEISGKWIPSPAVGPTSATGEFRVGFQLPAGAKADGGPDKITTRVLFDRSGVMKATASASMAPGSEMVAPGGTPSFGVLAWDQLAVA